MNKWFFVCERWRSRSQILFLAFLVRKGVRPTVKKANSDSWETKLTPTENGTLHRLQLLQQLGPKLRIYPESSKSILVVSPTMWNTSRLSLPAYGWVDGIKKLAVVARAYPQSAYSAFERSQQQEWQHLQRAQRTTPNI